MDAQYPDTAGYNHNHSPGPVLLCCGRSPCPSPSPPPVPHAVAARMGRQACPRSLPQSCLPPPPQGRWDRELGLDSSCQEVRHRCQEQSLKKSGLQATAGAVCPGHSMMRGMPALGEAMVECNTLPVQCRANLGKYLPKAFWKDKSWGVRVTS